MEHQITHSTVSRETFDAVNHLFQKHKKAFHSYINQLFWWNERINLVSRGVSRETILEHVRHSLLVQQLETYKKADFIVDAGTGGGLPGIPLAISSPEKQFLLNDIVSKKVMAVKQMARQLNLQNVETFDQSIAALKPGRPFLLISKHAFKTYHLMQLAADIPWTRMILYKGLSFKEELQDIGAPLDISVYDLGKNGYNEFYENKAILVISRQEADSTGSGI